MSFNDQQQVIRRTRNVVIARERKVKDNYTCHINS